MPPAARAGSRLTIRGRSLGRGARRDAWTSRPLHFVSNPQGPFEIERGGHVANSIVGNEDLRPETFGETRQELPPVDAEQSAEAGPWRGKLRKYCAILWPRKSCRDARTSGGRCWDQTCDPSPIVRERGARLSCASRGNLVLFFGPRNHARRRALPGGAEGIQTVMLSAMRSGDRGRSGAGWMRASLRFRYPRSRRQREDPAAVGHRWAMESLAPVERLKARPKDIGGWISPPVLGGRRGAQALPNDQASSPPPPFRAMAFLMDAR